MQETWVQSLGQEDPLEKAVATHSSILAWEISWTEEPGGLQSMRSLKSWTQLSDFTFTFDFHALEKEMATRSSVLAWRIPGMAAWWAAVYGVAQSRTRLKRLSSHSSSIYMKCLEYRQCLLVLAIVRILLL